MPIYVNSENNNPAGTLFPGVQLSIQPPQTIITGKNSSVIVVVGNASWGEEDKILPAFTTEMLKRNFGGITADSIADKFDMCTEGYIALQQATPKESVTLYGIRRCGVGAAKAAGNLKDTTAPTKKTAVVLTAKCKGKRGNEIVSSLSVGAKAGTYNLTVVGFDSLLIENFTAIPGGSTPQQFYANLISAVNNGLSAGRGPSKLVEASAGADISTAIAPDLDTVITLSGGADGRLTAASDFLGDDSAMPKTGIYAMSDFKEPVKLFWIAGCDDLDVTADFQVLQDRQGYGGLVTVPKGTDIMDAIGAKKTAGILSYNSYVCLDYKRWFDPQNKLYRIVSPLGFTAGRIGALSPEQSPLNKKVYGVVGSERDQHFTAQEVGLLMENGFLLIHNPCEGGDYWGFLTGVNSVGYSDEATAPVEYGTLTNWLAASIAGKMGSFIGQLQSKRPDDPLRLMVKHVFDEFGGILVQLGKIDDFFHLCNKSNNTDDLIARHFLIADCYYEYLSSVWRFVIRMQGGTTVNVDVIKSSKEELDGLRNAA